MDVTVLVKVGWSCRHIIRSLVAESKLGGEASYLVWGDSRVSDKHLVIAYAPCLAQRLN